MRPFARSGIVGTAEDEAAGTGICAAPPPHPGAARACGAEPGEVILAHIWPDVPFSRLRVMRGQEQSPTGLRGVFIRQIRWRGRAGGVEIISLGFSIYFRS